MFVNRLTGHVIDGEGCPSVPGPTHVTEDMEAFEQSVLKDYPGKAPKLWLRYVDDTFVVIDKSEADPFFKFINSVDPNIKCTQEECCDNKLALSPTAYLHPSSR